MKILNLTIENVRGLRSLDLPLNGKSIVIWGPNGAGKSCVVDAIDFLFTGEISRLTGEGTLGITLKGHGPHIDYKPEEATVTATVQLDGMTEPATIKRCIARPDQLECPPEVEPALDKITNVMRRGGVVLTRRDILRFITAKAGTRAEEIGELLNLEEVDDVRKSLQRAKSELEKREQGAQRDIKTAQVEVNVTLNLPTYSEAGLIDTVNATREVLGGQPISTPSSANLKDGIVRPIAREANDATVNLALLKQTLQNIKQNTETSSQQGLATHDGALRQQISDLKADPHLLAELGRLGLTEHAQQFVDESTVECPVCGTSWPEGHLKLHLDTRVAMAQDAKAASDRLVETAGAIAEPVRILRAWVEALIKAVQDSGLKTQLQGQLEVLETWQSGLTALAEALNDPMQLYPQGGMSNSDVARLLAPEALHELLDQLETTVVAKLPEPTTEQTAWDTLTRLQESVRALESRIADKELASSYSRRASALFSAFEMEREALLEGLYTRIADRFVEFYGVLHDHERGHFNAQLEPHGPALNLEVDFMGRGTHPPHALHSEGHQDSMGLCLFLALNEELSQEELQLIVLDDVVMSVDSGHRKDVCRLLNEKFPNCQFVITTHDKTWAKQLKQEHVVESKGAIEFTAWTLKDGPQTHQQIEMWEAIQADLDREDVHEAAFKLRRSSEEFFESVCDALGASVIYNSLAQWELEDWLFPAMDQYKDFLKRYRNASISWGNPAFVAAAEELESIRQQVYSKTYIEQWSINSSLHYNNWENMTKEDFEPVVAAFRDLRALFLCSGCGGYIERTPRKGPLKLVKCRCGRVSWNLQHKASAS